MRIWQTAPAGALVLAALTLATPARATALATCSVHDITPAALSCSGFFAGNLLNNSPAAVIAQQSDLAALGLVWNGNWATGTVEQISNLNGAHTIHFAHLLTGISYIAMHFGNGRGGPGNGTAFYKINAGAGLHDVTTVFNASSNAVLYRTGGAVPEPAAWATVITGLAIAGAALRRRQPRLATA